MIVLCQRHWCVRVLSCSNWWVASQQFLYCLWLNLLTNKLSILVLLSFYGIPTEVRKKQSSLTDGKQWISTRQRRYFKLRPKLGHLHGNHPKRIGRKFSNQNLFLSKICFWFDCLIVLRLSAWFPPGSSRLCLDFMFSVDFNALITSVIFFFF